MLSYDTEDNIYNDMNGLEINNNEANIKDNNTYAINKSKKMSTQNKVKDSNEKKMSNEDSTLFKDQSVKEILEYNKKLTEDNNKLKEKIEEEVKKSEQLSEKIKNLEKELNDEKKKNEDLTKELEVAKKNEPKEKEIIDVKSTIEKMEEFLQNILLRDKQISDLQKKLENCIILSEGEELISIIFIYEELHVHYSIICKNVDSLAIAEQKLFEKFPKMIEEEYNYYLNDTRLKRGYKFKDKNINNGAIITIKKRE